MAKATIGNDELVIKYGDGWDSWELFLENIGLGNMIEVQRTKLSKAKKSKGKGKEKGKDNGESKGNH